MKRGVLAVLLLLAACSSSVTPSTTVPTTAPATTSTTTTVDLADACSPPSFLPTVLPARVAPTQPASSSVPLDIFTTLPGTTIRVWSDASGEPVMVMVRGALPPEQWTATPEHITVRGIDAAFGPLEGGVWAAAWYEGPDTCDEYSVIFYPPVDIDEAKTVAESMTGSPS